MNVAPTSSASVRALGSVLGVVALLAGCGPTTPTEVHVSGVITEGPNEPGISTRVAGADLRLLSRNGVDEFGATLTGANGEFDVGGLPPNTGMVLVVGKEDGNDPHSYAVFTGGTASDDIIFFLGTVYTPRLDSTISLIADYAAAPGAPTILDTYTVDFGAPDNGGMIRGRIVRWESSESGLLAYTVPDASVQVEDINGASHPVCYRTDPVVNTNSGLADCSRTTTSDDSTFAAFGLPAGAVTITVTHPSYGVHVEQTLVVEDGVTYLDYFTVAHP